MARDSQRNLQLRTRIAQMAAQLMAEHGIRDHALAKRKAARQLGLTQPNVLPSNEEIDCELRAYQLLFDADDYRHSLQMLRVQALAVMRSLHRFRPTLTGGLVNGSVSPHSDIEIEVYSDSSKEFEQFLLNEGIGFKAEERRNGSFFVLYAEPADVNVRIMPLQSLQSAARGPAEGRRRLSIEQLQQVVECEADPLEARQGPAV